MLREYNAVERERTRENGREREYNENTTTIQREQREYNGSRTKTTGPNGIYYGKSCPVLSRFYTGATGQQREYIEATGKETREQRELVIFTLYMGVLITFCAFCQNVEKRGPNT